MLRAAGGVGHGCRNAMTFVLAIFFTKIFERMLASPTGRGAPGEKHGPLSSRRGLQQLGTETTSTQCLCHLQSCASATLQAGKLCLYAAICNMRCSSGYWRQEDGMAQLSA